MEERRPSETSPGPGPEPPSSGPEAPVRSPYSYILKPKDCDAAFDEILELLDQAILGPVERIDASVSHLSGPLAGMKEALSQSEDGVSSRRAALGLAYLALYVMQPEVDTYTQWAVNAAVLIIAECCKRLALLASKDEVLRMCAETKFFASKFDFPPFSMYLRAVCTVLGSSFTLRASQGDVLKPEFVRDEDATPRSLCVAKQAVSFLMMNAWTLPKKPVPDVVFRALKLGSEAWMKCKDRDVSKAKSIKVLFAVANEIGIVIHFRRSKTRPCGECWDKDDSFEGGGGGGGGEE